MFLTFLPPLNGQEYLMLQVVSWREIPTFVPIFGITEARPLSLSSPLQSFLSLILLIPHSQTLDWLVFFSPLGTDSRLPVSETFSFCFLTRIEQSSITLSHFFHPHLSLLLSLWTVTLIVSPAKLSMY